MHRWRSAVWKNGDPDERRGQGKSCALVCDSCGPKKKKKKKKKHDETREYPGRIMAVYDADVMSIQQVRKCARRCK